MHHYKNPQANSILESIHQVFGSIIKTKNLPNVTFNAVDSWSKIIAYILYVVRCLYHTALQSTPGKLVFGRDMLLGIHS